jgi:hypothetical protein
MRVRVAIATVVALGAAFGGLAAGTATASRVPNLDWTALLPALPSPKNPQPHGVPHCRRPSVRCLGTEVARMKRLRARLGCDHRAVFTTTYLVLTRTLRQMNRENPKLFPHPKYLYAEDALFADVYFKTFRGYNLGAKVAPAWRIAFQTAASGNANGAQDMLLGINAHVQNDMPFVVAALGLRNRKGGSRKKEHEAVNAVLNRAYEPVVRAITKRFDPLVGLTNSPATPLDDFAGLELVRGWREVVWRHAELLANAKTQAQREQIASEIQSYAATWATAIADANLNLPPGYRAQRDAYCRKQLRGA